MLGDLRRVELGLLARLREGVDPLDRHTGKIIDMMIRIMPMPLAIGPITPHLNEIHQPDRPL